jgi:hypothetical protein
LTLELSVDEASSTEAACALVAAAALSGIGVALTLELSVDEPFSNEAAWALVAASVVVELVSDVSACAAEPWVTFAIVDDEVVIALDAAVSETGAELNALKAA